MRVRHQGVISPHNSVLRLWHNQRPAEDADHLGDFDKSLPDKKTFQSFLPAYNVQSSLRGIDIHQGSLESNKRFMLEV